MARSAIRGRPRLAAAAAAGVRHVLAGADLHAALLVVGGRGAHALLDLAGHGQERLLDVAGVLGRGLEEGNAQAVGEFLRTSSQYVVRRIGGGPPASGAPLADRNHMQGRRAGTQRNPAYLGDGVLDDLLVRHIALVADEQLVDALSGVAVDLLQPLLDVVERVHVGHIVDNADAMGATVVGGGDGAEALLAGGIPLLRRQVSMVVGGFRQAGVGLTICSLTVFPSRSIVRIFCI